MDTFTSSLEAEANALAEAYAAFNRNDISMFVDMFDPQIEWIEPVEFPGGGTYRGLDVVREHIAKARETWAEGSCEPERMIVSRHAIVQFVNVRVRLKTEPEWREGNVTEVYTFRQGKIIQVRVFAERSQALQWAGVDTSQLT